MSKEGKFYASDCEYSYSIGPCDTREEAIEEYKSENDGREPEWVGISHEVFCHLDGESVIDDLANGSLHDELYEDALDSWCKFKRNDPRWDSLSERLTKVLHEWLDEVGEAKSWAVIDPRRNEPAPSGGGGGDEVP